MIPVVERRTCLLQRSWEGCGRFLGGNGHCLDTCFTSCNGRLRHNGASLDVKAVYY